ncbi:mechanosensitive ion channel family protein [Mucilaginibacter sp. KACC 22063]|uniref:mechanosensitive ion channel family protein n=1 Tax=Mucilaginibacter sp. KACC 22063 TaxID=3025666 RepID=UPI002365975E|nr:mechanosensitive ion channel family protein [Mucilaginibacter sp. KACC 22063]WDF56380.1 mechanosensitive ion channel family protein [Mucilaginibacter sp. KACC 22063]
MQFDKFYDKATDWVIRYGPRFVIGIIILLIGLWAINVFVSWSQRGMQRKSVDPSLKPFLVSLLGVALRVLLVLGVMQVIGIQMTLFATVIGALGVAAGLALSGTLQNFASGILILLLKPFTVGDNIITQGLEGTVSSIQIFYTIVITFDNRVVVVPNSKLSNEVIINISREGKRRLDINMRFPNIIDFNEVKAVLEKTIDASESCLKSPERRIGISELQADGYIVTVYVWVNAHGYMDNKLTLQEKLLESIKASGIKMAGL